jgi:lipopolysaccharide/colanic/teichoic acid biosynthesis glycosyltransferase
MQHPPLPTATAFTPLRQNGKQAAQPLRDEGQATIIGKVLGEAEQMPSTFYHRRGKRLLDLAIALPVATAVAPVMAVVAVATAATIGRPLLFRQTRPGLGGRPFDIAKFRTMSNARDASGALLPDEQRLTSIGRLVRGLSIDELPQLWNVLRGDMSLVGPRPLLVRYLDRYTPEQARRHEVPPGITGWTQVNGRNALSWEQKFDLDVWYVDHSGLALDLKILALTAFKVLRRDGVAATDHATMPEFMGTAATGLATDSASPLP